MPIYTRKGDSGTTSLYDGVHVSKDDAVFEVCGTIDELSASLGVVRAEGVPVPCETIILRIQQELIAFCTDLVFDMATISSKHVEQFEREIDQIELELPKLTQFIIAGDNRSSAMLHFARTICRRAERNLATLCRNDKKPSCLIAYLNRLSDLLFVLARKVASKESFGSSDTLP